MIRLFSAIKVSSEVASHLKGLRSYVPYLNWVDPEDFHVTLCFFGNISTDVANELYDILSISTIQPPLVLNGLRLDYLGGDNPHSLVVMLERNELLQNLNRRHERIARQLGITLDGRKFTPHITIARFKRLEFTYQELAQHLEHISFRPFSVPVDEWCLLSAKLSGGSPYKTEVCFPL